MYKRSSYCATGSCVEVDFKQSSFCGSTTCVQVAKEADEFYVRDSKEPEGAELVFTKEEWKAFVQGVKAGEFDFDIDFSDSEV